MGLVVGRAGEVAADGDIEERVEGSLGDLAPLVLTAADGLGVDGEEGRAVEPPGEGLGAEVVGGQVDLEAPEVVLAAGVGDAAEGLLLGAVGAREVQRALVRGRAVDELEDVPLAALRPADGRRPRLPDRLAQRPPRRPDALLLRVRPRADLGCEDHLVVRVARHAVLALQPARRPRVARAVVLRDDEQLSVARQLPVRRVLRVHLHLVVLVWPRVDQPIRGVGRRAGRPIEVVNPHHREPRDLGRLVRAGRRLRRRRDGVGCVVLRVALKRHVDRR